MLKARFGGNVLGGLCELPVAPYAQQVARQDHTLPAPLGQPLFDQAVSVLLRRLLDVAAKAQVAQVLAAADHY